MIFFPSSVYIFNKICSQGYFILACSQYQELLLCNLVVQIFEILTWFKSQRSKSTLERSRSPYLTPISSRQAPIFISFQLVLLVFCFVTQFLYKRENMEFTDLNSSFPLTTRDGGSFIWVSILCSNWVFHSVDPPQFQEVSQTFGWFPIPRLQRKPPCTCHFLLMHMCASLGQIKGSTFVAQLDPAKSFHKLCCFMCALHLVQYPHH